jgi:nitrogen fixation protein FixH
VLIFAMVLLAACGAPAWQSAETDRYTIRFQLEGSGVGNRTALIELRDRAGQPVAAESVVVAPVMNDMGMASPEVTAQPDGSGRYRGNNTLISMLGVWELAVRVRAGGAEDVATFRVEVR